MSELNATTTSTTAKIDRRRKEKVVVPDGKKKCNTPSCNTLLDIDFKFARCEPCREKERTNEKKRMESRKAMSVEEGHKLCNTCGKVFPIEQFEGPNGITTKTCAICRQHNKNADAKRDMDHYREMKRISERKPHRIAQKNEWKKKNYEKVVTYWMTSRKNRMNRMGVDEYLRHNADIMKQWREKNSERSQQLFQERYKKIANCYNSYVYWADRRGLSFQLSIDQYTEIVKSNCYYCGYLQAKGFNGIDRKDSKQGYLLENCVSCCGMCNMMKGCLDVASFIKHTKNILIYNELINEYPSTGRFRKMNPTSYNAYKTRASRKGLQFEITMEQYQNLISDDCYLCGSCDGNGIDRVDNTQGYIEENVQSCCSVCNYMKKHFTYDSFIEKLIMIWETNKNNPLLNSGHSSNDISIITNNENKKSKQQCAEESRTNAETRRKALSDRYNNEEYVQEKAEELARRRQENNMVETDHEESDEDNGEEEEDIIDEDDKIDYEILEMAVQEMAR